MVIPEGSFYSHLTNSAIVVAMIQWLKGTARYKRFAAWLPIADKKVHIIASMVGAGASSFGIHGAVTGSLLAGGVYSFTLPPLWVMLHAGWDWVSQVFLNWLTYVIAVQQRAAAPVATEQVIPKLAVTQPLAEAVQEKI